MLDDFSSELVNHPCLSDGMLSAFYICLYFFLFIVFWIIQLVYQDFDERY